MLSRVAESLYWTARYVERAEAVSRALHVSFHTLLDADEAEHRETWRRLLWITGTDDLYREHFDGYDAEYVSEFLLWRDENPNSVVACAARARENARGVRDQISTEMWEELNRLHLFLGTASRRGGAARAQHELFVRVRRGSHALQGVMHATLPRGEAFEFLGLGTHAERADMTARTLAVVSPVVSALPPETREEAVRLTALLRSCGAFEAFRTAERSLLRAPRVLEYLLLDRSCPRSVLFCLDACLRSLGAIAGASDRPERTIGRVTSELAFVELSELHGRRLAPLLDRVLAGIDGAGREIAATFFSTRVLVPGAYAQAQQQQQQQ
jgi:uncharacterized alpha-E superfamily protein